MKIKRGLMTQFPYSRGRPFVAKNIGDYIQSVAAKQYVAEIDEYIEQEEANRYFPPDKKPIRLIMNGWFQWRAENWPPSEYIIPLLISMHISPLKAKDLLTPEGIAFFKKHAPVGCRDYYTQHLLESVGIPAYFSACMTLTLGKNYKVDDSRRNGIYFVDPYFPIPALYQEKSGELLVNNELVLETFSFYLNHKEIIDHLAKKEFFRTFSSNGIFIDRDYSLYRPIYKATLFYKAYSQKFDDNTLLNAEYIAHFIDVDMSGNVSNEDLLNIAEDLIKKYASAKLVITSRIHAGLPCLGLGTPTVFIANDDILSENRKFNTPGRLGGLIDLFRVLNLENNFFSTEDPILQKIYKFDTNTTFSNKNDWKKYAEQLDKKASEFMHG